jgi:thiamine pyrophosphokinase
MEKQRAVIFVNGELPYLEALRRLIQPDDYLVAVDGGLRHVLALGLPPRLLIGDLDSVTSEQIAAMTARGVEVRRFAPRKDETDLQLAVQAVHEAGYRQVLLVAALGGRLDHTLGNLYLLTDPALADCEVRLDDGVEEVFLIRETGEVKGMAGDLVSLLPVEESASGVTTAGLEYPLRAEVLWRHQPRGVSNVMLGEKAGISVTDGTLFCIHTRQGPNINIRS